MSVITLIVSIYCAKYYGERGVEIARRRREHSVRLKEEALERWLNTLQSCIGFIRRKERIVKGVFITKNRRFKPIEPRDPPTEFFEYFKQHLETGYPNILKKWEKIKQMALSVNKQTANFLEKLCSIIAKEMKAEREKEPRHLLYRRPIRFVYPRFAEAVYTELQSLLITKERKIRYLHEEIKYENMEYTLSYDGSLIYKSNRVRDLKKGQTLFEKLIASQENLQEVKKLIEQRQEVEKELRNFEKALRELKDSIDLGNILKGKCEYCPEKV